MKDLDNVISKDQEVIELKAPYPWRRYLARMLDLSFYGIPWTIVSHLILRWKGTGNLGYTIINLFLPWVILILLEPLLLSQIGTSLGKGIFGLKVRDLNGDKLTYGNALYRTYGVFSKGAGYSIPGYNVYRFYKSYITCKDGRLLDWDEGVNYTLIDKKPLRIVAIVLVNILVILISVLIMFQAQLPSHRGDLTAEQFFDNCNDFMKYNDIDYGKVLDGSGNWFEKTQPDGYTITLFENSLPTYSVTLENGFVKSVQVEVEGEYEGWISGYTNHLVIAAMSFIPAQEGVSFQDLSKIHLIEKLGTGLEDYSFEEVGIQISNEVEYKGYDKISDNHLLPVEGEEQYFHMIFKMEKLY